jgi:tRNA(Leu) C34 or U34 (ribose-2'-O)-methylase TrmL
VTTQFACDENLGYLVRAAACYGAEAVHVIGALPPSRDLKRLSGSTDNLVPIIRHRDPSDFLEWKRDNDGDGLLVAAELTADSIPIGDFSFQTAVTTYIAVGNEETGVPVEMLHRAAAVVHIPMPGPGFCLNTAQTANVFAFEYVRQRDVHLRQGNIKYDHATARGKLGDQAGLAGGA